MKYYHVYGWSDCSFCDAAIVLLRKQKEQFMYTFLDDSDELLNHFKTKYDCTTVPIIVLKEVGSDVEKFIGGYSDLLKVFETIDTKEGNFGSN